MEIIGCVIIGILICLLLTIYRGIDSITHNQKVIYTRLGSIEERIDNK